MNPQAAACEEQHGTGHAAPAEAAAQAQAAPEQAGPMAHAAPEHAAVPMHVAAQAHAAALAVAAALPPALPAQAPPQAKAAARVLVPFAHDSSLLGLASGSLRCEWPKSFNIAQPSGRLQLSSSKKRIENAEIQLIPRPQSLG